MRTITRFIAVICSLAMLGTPRRPAELYIAP